MVDRGSQPLNDALALIAPGTALREGLDRILQAKHGALIVIGDDPGVLSVCTGGFLLDAEYSPQREHTISPTDPALAIDWPGGHELVISDRDAAAPSLDEARAAGLLPTWDEARAFVEGLRNR